MTFLETKINRNINSEAFASALSNIMGQVDRLVLLMIIRKKYSKQLCCETSVVLIVSYTEMHFKCVAPLVHFERNWMSDNNRKKIRGGENLKSKQRMGCEVFFKVFAWNRKRENFVYIVSSVGKPLQLSLPSK